MKPGDEDNQGPVIRDRRRIDPLTGKVRDTGQGGSSQGGPGQPRPGRHSVSRPGGIPGSAAGDGPRGGTGSARPPGPGSGGGPASAGPGAAGMDSAPGAAGAAAATGGSAGDGPGPGGPAAGTGGSGASDLAAADAAFRLAERTADLQRISAEYANYRKRVERDRMAVREQALANVLIGLLPVLDDIGRAREHEELTGGFKSVAESLEAVAAKLGLTTYGENGDPFDPNLHEALMHSYSSDVSEPTCVRILQPGYKVGDRILRPARVAVAEPGDDADEGDSADEDATADEHATSDSGRPAGRQGDAPPSQDADKPGDHAPDGAD